jgi:hypothetical protein
MKIRITDCPNGKKQFQISNSTRNYVNSENRSVSNGDNFLNYLSARLGNLARFLFMGKLPSFEFQIPMSTIFSC